jgi:hypothetical protein
VEPNTSYQEEVTSGLSHAAAGLPAPGAAWEAERTSDSPAVQVRMGGGAGYLKISATHSRY